MDKEKIEEKNITPEEVSNSTPPEENSSGPKTISAEEVKKQSVKAEKDKKTQKKERKELKKALRKKKKREKSDFINFLLIFAIFILLTIIITPPVLRKVMPKLSLEKPNDDKNIIVLACNAYNIEEQYEITSRSKYVDDVLLQNIITYKKINPEDLSSIPANKITKLSVPSLELSFFRAIRGIDISEKDTKIIVTIYDYVANKYSANKKLNNHFQPKEQQKAYYTGMGYICEEEVANE